MASGALPIYKTCRFFAVRERVDILEKITIALEVAPAPNVNT